MKQMYLHIGNNCSVYLPDVIGIFDMDNTTVDRCTKTLLEKAEREHRVYYATCELPKSFVITERNGVCRIWVSQLAAGTLRKRLGGGGKEYE